ncbi:MAG: nucleoside triphosphate pyrophosphohydrolase [Halofilum sp. (in: g-proteobacteria)]|nr:nucleoside triphosphate pyrophosphohydrolase [Halofilum sp. (in: g-proteobacteria)]
MAAIDDVLAIMARLRDPERGCPWDLAQDFRSIAPHTVEEAYEVADAIERGDLDGLRDELGDLLLQVVYHARMAEEAGRFDFADVAAGLADKLVRRHPHVFGDTAADTAGERERIWEREKAAERAAKGEDDASALAGVTLGLPALARAQKLQKRAARVGFDWPHAAGAAAKVSEELAEIEAAGDDPDALEAEVGDLLFAAVNLARHHGVDAETALRRAGNRFERRFRALEASLAAEGSAASEADLEELEAHWQRAKGTEPGR